MRFIGRVGFEALPLCVSTGGFEPPTPNIVIQNGVAL